MFKNLLKKNMIVIFGVALLCSALVTYSFIRSSSKTGSFEQSGYVHVDANESEDKKVLFSGGQKYKNIVDSKIKFNDSANKERRISNTNFIHYDDNSIAAFCEGVIVNTDELSSELSTMNHFHITPGMPLRNTGSSFTAENSGMEIDFSNFLWKVSENKYLAVSKSMNAKFSETDSRDCSGYAEITYLDGKVIQIQTDDNIWQTISDECTLTLDNGYIFDLSMKNIKDPQGNVLLDFSRIVINSDDNVELTPLDSDMEALQDNTVPHFTVNNTPGDAGADGYSGTIGLTGQPGNPGNKGQQGNEGLAGERQDESNVVKFPIFSLSDWHVEATRCWGDIIVEDDSEILAPETASLVSKIYLIDLDTGENIYEDRIVIQNGVPKIDAGTYDFRGVRNNSSSKVHFEFDGLKTDHSYMLYASAPLKVSDDTDVYSRGFLTKTFWTDSTGVYMENSKIEAHSYQVLIHNVNTHSGVGVYILDKPISDFNVASTITLEDLNSHVYDPTGLNLPLNLTELWPYNSTSGAAVEANQTIDYTAFVNSSGSNENLHSNSYYYTLLAYDLDGDASNFEDYSIQVLSTLTLKERPVVDAPRITSNRNIWGFDVHAGILTDIDNGVVKINCEFYEINEENFENYAEYETLNPDGSRKIDSSLLILKDGAKPTRNIEIGNVSSAALSLAGANSGDYVCREVLTVYDNEKEYQIASKFSNAAELVASSRPYVYFTQWNTQQTGTATEQNKYSQSPFYDSIFGMLHISPGTDGYKYAVNSNSYVEISGESYYYSYPIRMTEDVPAGDNGIYLKAQPGENGEIQVRFPDYEDSGHSWASGLKPGQTYHITVYGDLYDGPYDNSEVSQDSEDENIRKSIKEYSAEVGHCEITTPETTTMFLAMSTKPNSDDLTKNLAIGLANPSTLRNKLNINKTAAEEDQYYRQMDTLYGVRVSVYLGNYENEYRWEKSIDTEVVPGKKYYFVGTNGSYEEVSFADIPNPNKEKNPNSEGWYEKTGETWNLSTDTEVADGKKYYTKTGTDTYEEVSFAGTPNPNKSKNPSMSMWFEYVYNTLPDVWTSKLFTADTPWTVGIENPTQLYQYYDSRMALFADGVQVTTEVDTDPESSTFGKTVLVRTKNGAVPLSGKTYIYNEYEYDENTKEWKANNANGKVVLNDNGSIEGTVTNTKRLKKLFTIDRITDVDVSKSVTDNITDYKVESGGIVLSQNDFMVGNMTFADAVLADEIGAIAQNYTGATFIVEELYDYTGNSNDKSLTNQRNVRVASTDSTIQNSDTYYKKNGETYTPVIINNKISPKNARWYEIENINGVDTYRLSSDNEMIEDGTKRYYDLVDAANLRYELVPLYAANVSPKALGWYEDTDQNYINYFTVEGETRIFIPFVRNIGYIDIKEPYRTGNDGDGRIVRMPTDASESDGYHYYYSVQANFTNTSLLADSITYYVYDSVDFFNTTKFKNNSTDLVNWALLGKDPRSADPTSGIKNSWTVQNVQTVSQDTTEHPDKREFVYELVDVSTTEAVTKIMTPYLYGWYEKTADGKYYITDEKTFAGAQTQAQANNMFIDNGPGATDFEPFNPSATNPKSLGLFVENITLTEDTSIQPSRIYYAEVLENGEPTYKVIDTKTVSPAGFGWYEKDALGEPFFTSDTSVDSGHIYFYYDGDDYSPVPNPGSMTIGNVNPHSLKWYYGEMSLTDHETVHSDSRYYVKLLVNVHSNENELNSGAYSNFDTTISPVSRNYYEAEKVKTNLNSVFDNETGELLNTTFYASYEGEYGTCFEVVDLTKNSNLAKNPLSEGWYVDKPEGTKVASNDKYYDINKTYYDNGGSLVTNISPKDQKWFEVKKKTVTDTEIDYSKNYYLSDGTSIDLNINPSQLGWLEKKKEVTTDTKVISGHTYYYGTTNGTNTTYSYIDTSSYNPFVLGWREIKYTLSENETPQPYVDTETGEAVDYYAKRSDGKFVRVYSDLTNPVIDPRDNEGNGLGWTVNKLDNTTLSYSKIQTTDPTLVSGTSYYAPVGQTYVKVTSTTATPKLLGWFTAEKILTKDSSCIPGKDYYSGDGDLFNFSADSDTPNNGHVDPAALGWYVDVDTTTPESYVASNDTKYDSLKTYYFTNASGEIVPVSGSFNPATLGWQEEVYELSEDEDLSDIDNKQYYVRYLTNNYASTAVTTEGLELAKITVPFDGKTITPSINFYPCTYEYAMNEDIGDPYGLGSALDTENCMFLYPGSTEELYGHQFVFAWTLNYHSYLDESWHYSYPYDATTKSISGSTADVRFVDLALDGNDNIFVSKVSGMGIDSFDDKQTTPSTVVFGKNAYMIIPHNYILKDEPKKVPSVYSLQWSSGIEKDSSDNNNKYIVNRALVYDPYKAVSGTSSTADTTSTSAYLIGNTNRKLSSVIRANTKLTSGFTNGNAVKNLVTENDTLVSDDGYAINEVKVTAADMTGVGTPLTNGAGDAKLYVPIQLYSNKYVKGNQTLHTGLGQNYYTGSGDFYTDPNGYSDNNWKFKNTTANSDKYSSLYTAVFFPDVNFMDAADPAVDIRVDDPNNHESELIIKPKITSGKQVGYTAELIIPATAKTLLDEIVGIRIRFDVYDYAIVAKDQYSAPDPSAPSEPNPNALKLYEQTVTKEICRDTDVHIVEDRMYFAKKDATDDYTEEIINPGKTGGHAIDPKLFGLYEKEIPTGQTEDDVTAVLSERSTYDVEGEDGATIKYYYDSAAEKEFDKDDINPFLLGWKYALTVEGDVIPTKDTSWDSAKTYCTQKDIIYSLSVDKYLAFLVNDDAYDKDQYGSLGGEPAQNKVDNEGETGDNDGQIHIYFAISNDDIKSDTNYEIGDAFNKMISGKNGIHLSAQYLFEGDQAGYSYLKFDGPVNDAETRKAVLSNKANGIINNKELGTFALRTYSFAQTEGQNFFTSQGHNWDVPYDTQSTKTPFDVYHTSEVDFKKFGSFYQIGGITASEPKIVYKTTREAGSDSVFTTYQKDINSEVKTGVTYYVPTLLTTVGDIKVNSTLYSKENNVVTEKQPEIILDFPSGDQFVTFNKNVENDGALVKRQNATLRFGFSGITSGTEIYALVTTNEITQNYADKAAENTETGQNMVPMDYFNTFYFDNASNGSSSVRKNVIGLVKKEADIDPAPVNAAISAKAIYTRVNEIDYPTTAKYASSYFAAMAADADPDSLDYKKMFIKVAGSGPSETLDLGALPYPDSESDKNFYVTFWKWTLLNSEKGIYGWERIPYSVDLKYDVSLNFKTSTPSYPTLTAKYEANEYENKTLKFSIGNLADDAYYIVDLFDKKEDKIVSYLQASSTYDPLSKEYTVDVDGSNLTPSTDNNIFFKANANNSVQPNGNNQFVNVVNGTDGDYKFEYGKHNGDERYVVQLRSYLLGTGPAANAYTTADDWKKDLASLYNTYQYVLDTSGPSEVVSLDKEHHVMTAPATVLRSYEFSVNNEFDNVGILKTNSSNLKTTPDNVSGAYIEFLLEAWTPKSYSLYKEKYIPVVVLYSGGTDHTIKDVFTLDELNKKEVNGALLSNDNELGVVKVNGIDTLNFNDNKNPKFRFYTDEVYDNDGTVTTRYRHITGEKTYDYEVGDYFTLYIFGVQDDITSGKQILLNDAENFKTFIEGGNFENIVSGTAADTNTGLRLIACTTEAIKNKSVEVSKVQTTVTSSVVQEYLEVAEYYHQETLREAVIRNNLNDSKRDAEADKNALVTAQNNYNRETSDDRKQAYINDTKSAFIKMYNKTPAGKANPIEEDDERFLSTYKPAEDTEREEDERISFYDMMVEEFMETDAVVAAKRALDLAKLKYGYAVVLDANGAYKSDGEKVYKDSEGNVVPATTDGAIKTHGSKDLYYDNAMRYGYYDQSQTASQEVYAKITDNGKFETAKTNNWLQVESGNVIQILPAADGHIPDLGIEVCAKGTAGAYKVDGVVQNTVKKKTVLETTGSISYKVNIDLIDCEGSTPFANLKYTIEFFNGTNSVGKKTETVPVNQNATTKDFSIEVPVASGTGSTLKDRWSETDHTRIVVTVELEEPTHSPITAAQVEGIFTGQKIVINTDSSHIESPDDRFKPPVFNQTTSRNGDGFVDATYTFEKK